VANGTYCKEKKELKYVEVKKLYGESKLSFLAMEGSSGLRKGAWSKFEDELLKACVDLYGEGKWHLVPQRAGALLYIFSLFVHCLWLKMI